MKKNIVYLLIVVILLTLDQITKAWATANLAGKTSIRIIEGFFYLSYATNTGAAWSILEGQRWFFIIMAIVAFIVLLVWFIQNEGFLGKLALSLMMAGTLGNLADRLFLAYVRDWLDFYPFGYDFPVFNIADSCLCVGVAILFLDILRSESKWQEKN